jgi:hypothetical protein
MEPSTIISMLSLLSLPISIFAIVIQHYGKIKSENLKTNHALDLQRYKDLKNLYKKISESYININKKRKKLPDIIRPEEKKHIKPIIDEAIAEADKLNDLFILNKFLLSKNSENKVTKLFTRLIKSTNGQDIQEGMNDLFTFHLKLIEIINNELFNLINTK